MELKATAGTDFYLRDFVAKKVMGAATVRSGNRALCAVSFLGDGGGQHLCVLAIMVQ